MDNMTERGPYLTNPKEIKRYRKTQQIKMPEKEVGDKSPASYDTVY